MTAHSAPSRRGVRRLDAASLALLLLSLACGSIVYLLISREGMNPLFLVPAVVAATVAASNLIKRQAPPGRH